MPRPPTRLFRVGARSFASERKALEIAEGLAPMLNRSARLLRRVEQLSQNVTFTVTTRTISRERIQAYRGSLRLPAIDRLLARDDEKGRTAMRLRALGFEVLDEGWFGVVARGPAELARSVLGVELVLQARAGLARLRSTQIFRHNPGPPLPEELFVAPHRSLSLPADFSDDADDVVFEPPPLYFQPVSATAPACAYPTIDIATVRRHLNVPAGRTGAGAVVGMIDTGFYPHPYFAANGLDIERVSTRPGDTPEIDEVGHGTAMAFNVFAVAPGARVKGFKHDLSLPAHVPLQRAGQAAMGVDIVSCSWGFEEEQVFGVVRATIQKLVADGKIVLFAAGNGVRAWPASMNEVVAVGGVYADPAGRLEASNYASGFASIRYPGRIVPDVCGLCGQTPRGIYLMLPCPPGSRLDAAQAVAATGPADPAFPDSDETDGSDGWAGASGTSAATAQIAGVASLLVAEARRLGKVLDNGGLKSILARSATPVSIGRNFFGVEAAGPLPNQATGHGLVNTEAALKLVGQA